MNPIRRVWWAVNPTKMRICLQAERLRHRARAMPTKWGRTPWPVVGAYGERIRIGVVVVNYNTREHIARLLYSLARNVRPDPVARVVVVDNASTDGSVELLSACQEAGLIELIRNRQQRYHGPGVNQGIEYLSRSMRSGSTTRGVDLIWVLDSDTVVTDAAGVRQAAAEIIRTGAGMAGEHQYGLNSLPSGYAHVCSLLLNPARVWQRRIEPLWESGTPAEALQLSCEKHNIKRLDFGFMRHGHVIHLGSGTLTAIREGGEQRNRYAQWATNGCTPEHFHGNPSAPAAYAQFLDEYRSAIPNGSIDELIAFCRNVDRQ